jgi:hypothetical protein
MFEWADLDCLVDHFLHTLKIPNVYGYCMYIPANLANLTFNCADSRMSRIWVRRERLHRSVRGAFRRNNNYISVVGVNPS